ncbi:MAG: precorrin-6y C5,15-methyltransferase (decarboxylating) subunit CbiE [Mariprofundaceae bacterium]|nr:precorrin-6y C5,15-methyltransferase (decarboxylating) subunit CbiE [Mariprofundaceae bacterium]
MNQSVKQVCVLGVLDNGWEGLAAWQQQVIAQADIVIGSERVLAMFHKHVSANTRCRDLGGHLSDVPEWINIAWQADQQVVVLATGDPLCHGIASYLGKKLGYARLNIIPQASAMQWACARFGVPWHGAKICSIHSKDTGEWKDMRGVSHGLYPLFHACCQDDTIVVFTSPQNSPARIARMLLTEGLDAYFDMRVAESLLQADEQLVQGLTCAELASRHYADLNMVLLQRTTPLPAVVRFGLDDVSFSQRKPDKGLITKREVRAVSLAMMQLQPHHIVWDIGAGSGAVGLEAARLCPDGWVYAIEKNSADVAIAQQNQQRMGVHHYTLVHSKAPECLNAWPAPDAVFVGGSGGELASLIAWVVSRLKADGHLVMNFVTIENLATATATLKTMAVAWSVTQMQVSRSKPILHMHRMAAENPVWIVSVSRTGEGEV